MYLEQEEMRQSVCISSVAAEAEQLLLISSQKLSHGPRILEGPPLSELQVGIRAKQK